MTWQIIKYASYVSTLTKDEVIKIFQEYLEKNKDSKNAEVELQSFFEIDEMEDLILNEGGTSQRLILVAGNFRKEITSSVLWLMNFGLKIQCIKATPFKSDEKLLLNMEQIIPVKDIEDLTIKMAEKEKQIVETKTQKYKYTRGYHLDGKSEKVKQWYLDLLDIILKDIPGVEENFRKYYIGLKIKNMNIFGFDFNNDDMYITSFRGKNISKNIIELSEKIGVELQPYYGSNADKDADYGRIKWKIKDDKSYKVAKRIIDYRINQYDK